MCKNKKLRAASASMLRTRLAMSLFHSYPHLGINCVALQNSKGSSRPVMIGSQHSHERDCLVYCNVLCTSCIQPSALPRKRSLDRG